MTPARAQGFLPWNSLPDEALDPPIAPLVRALNQTTWACTIFSCAGHPEEPDSVKTGRRQAHIDLVISDDPRWRTFVAAVKRATHGVRVAEGSLGPLPTWLTPQLPPTNRWTYRRLVVEPTSYDLPPNECRRILDAALATALDALATREP